MYTLVYDGFEIEIKNYTLDQTNLSRKIWQMSEKTIPRYYFAAL